MASTLHHCVDGGAVVHRPDRQPAWLFQWTSRPRITLCSALVCTVCHKQVRWGVGFFRALESDRSVVASIAQSLQRETEWLRVNGVEASSHHTLYACDCFYFSETSASAALTLDVLSGELTRNLPWACSGHPAISLPFRLGDVIVETEDDWTSALNRLLAADDQLALRDLLHCAADGALENAAVHCVGEWARKGPFSGPLKRLLTEEPEWAPLSELVEEVIRGQTLQSAQRPLERRTDVAEVLAAYVLRDSNRPDRDAILALLEAEGESLVLPPTLVAALRRLAPSVLLTHLERWLQQCPTAAGPLLAAATDLVMSESYDSDANVQRIAGWIRRTGLSRSELLRQTEPYLMPLWADRGPLFQRALEAVRPE